MKFAALFAAMLTLGFSEAGGQSPIDSDALLARRVTIHVRDVSLRDALDRVAAVAGIRLSYSAENLPLDRRVSVSRDSSTLSEVLDDLLHIFGVRPVVMGKDHIVLAVREVSIADTLMRDLTVLDQVVVTGSAIGAPERPLPIAIDVVRGRDIERHNQQRLSGVLDENVPGIWVWEQMPSSMMARYGSIRGASSFGLSFPKVYVDGIEVANPLLLTRITPELIERVEVIRGPQGAAMYGADAISGVVNIVSRHEGTGPDGSHVYLRSEAGRTSSAYTATAVPVQEHALTVRMGSNLRSGGVTLGLSNTGDYIPQAYSHELRALADARVIGARSTWDATLRLFGKNAGIPPNPLLFAISPALYKADSIPQQLRTYALGSTLTLVPTEKWTYTFTGGLDGYQLSNVSNELSPIPPIADTALRSATGSAVRGTLRASAVTSFGDPQHVAATLTFGGEQSWLRDRTLGQLDPTGVVGAPASVREYVIGISSNTGVSAQANVAFADALFLTAGARRESIGQTLGASETANLPMLGAAFVRDFSFITVKARAAYGKGIRPPHAALELREGTKSIVNNPDLVPEQQSGTEAGVDLFITRAVALHLTHFDQLASGLIQTTLYVLDSTAKDSTQWAYGYQLQNVGEITNRGWEAQGSLSLSSLSLSGPMSFVDSRVGRIARRYTGDLRVGDRMLGVPARTISGTAAWSSGGFHVSSTVSRASDWVNYDRLTIAKTWINLNRQGSPTAANFVGTKLRTYWARYGGATRWRAATSYEVWRGTLLTVTGDNLLNFQQGESDTITIIPGRTITVGIKARF